MNKNSLKIQQLKEILEIIKFYKIKLIKRI